jgi:hypothetical protein
MHLGEPAALITVPDVTVIQRHPRRLIDDFAWFDPAHRRQAVAYLQGLQIAGARQLRLQIPLYVYGMLELVATDVKDRVCALVTQTVPTTPFCYEYPAQRALSISQFSGDQVRQQDGDYQWRYVPLSEFTRLIPPHALTAMVALEQAGIRPQAYWVADLVKMYTSGRSLDPVLCAQFHQWFVGIAAWR